MRASLGLGANLGDRAAALQQAVDGLAAAGVEVVAVSRVYATDPVGGPDQPEYLNAAVEIETGRTPHEILALAQSLEAAAHRVRIERWGPRTLDVDVLLVGDLVVNDSDLVVPHPRMWERGFVVAPLLDVRPDLRSSLQVAAGGSDWEGVRLTAVPLLPPEHR